MEKDFDSWNIKKKSIHMENVPKFCHPREVWWCALGTNVGAEQDGTGKNFDRPVAVIKRFNEKAFFGVALTGRRREGRYYFPLGTISRRESSAILSQVRLIDTKRLIKKIEILDKVVFKALKSALSAALFE